MNPLADADHAALDDYLAGRAPSKSTAPLSKRGGRNQVSQLLSVELPTGAPPCQVGRIGVTKT